jgi:hypothetical protein
MLKVIYAETGQYLEHSPSAVADWLTQQHRLANHMGQPLVVERCTGTILLPANDEVVSGVDRLLAAQPDDVQADWSYADPDMIEVVMAGLWVSPVANGHEGAFLVDMGDRTALTLMGFWADAARQLSAISR